MSQSRKKRKDETWTNEELEAALRKEPRPNRKDRSKSDQESGSGSSRRHRSEKDVRSTPSAKPSTTAIDDDRQRRREDKDRRPDGRHSGKRSKQDEDYGKERERKKALERKASEGRTDERDRDEKRERGSADDGRDRKSKKERRSKDTREEKKYAHFDEKLERELQRHEKEERRKRRDAERQLKNGDQRSSYPDLRDSPRSSKSGDHRDKDHDVEHRESHHRDRDRDTDRRHRDREDKERHHDSNRHHRDRDRDAKRHHRDKDRDAQRHHPDRDHDERRHHRDSERRHRDRDDKERHHRDKDRRDGELRDKKQYEKERRQKELFDVARTESSRVRSRETSPSEIVTASRTESKRQEETAADDNDYNYDDEEFEDYEDDFEDDDDDSEPAGPTPEVNAVIAAIKQENERVTSARTMSSLSDRGSPPVDKFRASPTHMEMTSVNFTAAKKIKAGSRIAKSMMKRRNDLINLIQLDVISFDLFDLPPVTEYNFYIKNFGSQNTRQIATQCNEDALDADVQTEVPDALEKWTQHPQDGAFVSGGTKEDTGSNMSEVYLSLMREGSQRFGSFMNYANNLVESSFAENRIWNSDKMKQGSILSCCDSCTKFNTKLSYLQGRQILHTVFGEGGQMAITFGFSSHKGATRLDSKGLVTVWKMTNTEQPDKILVCDALPTCCCFGPKKKNLLFVGTDDGSVLVYDLSEPSTMHQNREIEKNMMSVLRSPTYTTGWQNDVHRNPIVCLNSVGNFRNSNQIFSLDESGRICIWTVVDILSEVDDDIGLAPLGKVKLVKTAPVDVKISKSATNYELGVRATCAVCPDGGVFYVGTESGSVMSLTRDRKLKSYRSHGFGDVTAVSISQFNSLLMLVSYSDGILALFHVKQEAPLMTWSLDNSLLFCDWSNCRSSVFFALDSTDQLHVWDLMALDSGPVVSDLFQNKTLRLCVDGYAKKTTDLMVAYDACAFEVHRISSHFTDSVTSDESDKMISLLFSFG